jgi:hypothetical protein
MDAIQKTKGPHFSTSRKEKRLNKKRTNSARRQAGRREIRDL